jgi:hypothetical protein
MKRLSPVLVHLQNPREKVWGILLGIETSGVTVQGIDLNSFDDWLRGVARGETDMGLSTVFFPIHRVERVGLDESFGSVLSLADTFESRVGKDVWTYLGLSSRRTLREAEGEYVESVLAECDWDRTAAARVLDVSTEDLEVKIEELGLKPR